MNYNENLLLYPPENNRILTKKILFKNNNKIIYPNIDDNDFQKKIKKIYNKFIINKNLSFKEICFPKKFIYQAPQLFVAEYVNPNTPYKGLLLYHKIGAGKTCAAINIAEKWKNKLQIIFVCPASLINNVYYELRSKCTGYEYMTDEERARLMLYNPGSSEYKNIIDKVNNKINKYYKILSYNNFVNLSLSNKINLNNHLLIIDEVHNIVSETGLFYNTFLKEINNSGKNLRIVLMSATPMFDKPIEIALTINLLKPNIKIPINPTFNLTFLKQISSSTNDNYTYELKNANKLKKLLTGYISYYKGAPNYVFPQKIIKIVKCKMSNYQYSCYKAIEDIEGTIKIGDILKLPNNFYIGSRMISNIAFPKKLINKEGYDAFNNKCLREDLNIYSIKFYKILKNIKKCNGTCFVYSNFKDYGGILTFIKVLEYNGYKNFNINGPGKNRFAIWTSDIDNTIKEYTKNIFNAKDNYNGSSIKIILGSPSIKEGVSLLRVKQVHIMEPYWNISRLNQVMGRAVRFCSHRDLSIKDREVTIYIYVATSNNNNLMIDMHILNIAKSKDKLIKQFEQVIKDSAIDYYLFQ